MPLAAQMAEQSASELIQKIMRSLARASAQTFKPHGRTCTEVCSDAGGGAGHNKRRRTNE